ncbi:hypothetical protein NNC19_16895 [Clostridium sp. SHJSY1]|uniref:hypothetical protein n=1 Tax=Clostridium sp. SHJSY1 TaxID=2942483 RepID=UPI0028762BDA|nr:hypothetical protein [Clostridium sp. SHJSY1]MDS0527370.1 hypothetical protein [Clostridium sp. SHJSY1]
MEEKGKLTPHEIIELRELLDSNVVGAKKIQDSMSKVNDDELESFMEKCLDSKKENISTIENFIKNNFSIQ